MNVEMTGIPLLYATRRLAAVAIAATLLACARGSVRNESAETPDAPDTVADSARVVGLAITAVATRPDTLIEYEVIQFTADSLGWVVSLVPQVRAPYADSIVISGGGGLVRVWRGDRVTVLNWYR